MITVFLFFIFSILLFVRPKYAFLLFIFFYPLIPKYINIEIPGLNIYIPQQTIMLLLLILVTLLLLLAGQIKQKYWMLMKEKKILLLLSIFLMVKLVATLLLSEDKTGGIISISYYMLDSFIVIILAAIYINSESMIRKLLFTLFTSYIIVILFAYLEKYYGGNIFLEFVDLRYSFYTDMIEGNIRNAEYRLMGAFSNTLLLTSYLSVMLGLIVSIPNLLKAYEFHILKYFIFFLSIPLIYWTYSRTGLVLLSIYFILQFIVFIYKKVSYRIKNIVKKFIYFVGIISIIGLLLNINIIFEYMISSSSDASESASITARINQFATTADIVSNSILLGKGVSRDIIGTTEMLSTLDNYYLRVFIESGLLGLGLFLLFLYQVYRTAIRLLNINLEKKDRLIIYATTLSFVLMVVNLFLISLPDNHIYLYLLVYIILYYSNKYTKITRKSV